MSLGGKGIISASANVAPETFVSIYDEMNANNHAKALEHQMNLLPLINALFMETNPAPAKKALSIMGKIPSDSLRLPLVPVSSATEKALKAVL